MHSDRHNMENGSGRERLRRPWQCELESEAQTPAAAKIDNTVFAIDPVTTRPVGSNEGLPKTALALRCVTGLAGITVLVWKSAFDGRVCLVIPSCVINTRSVTVTLPSALTTTPIATGQCGGWKW